VVGEGGGGGGGGGKNRHSDGDTKEIPHVLFHRHYPTSGSNNYITFLNNYLQEN